MLETSVLQFSQPEPPVESRKDRDVPPYSVCNTRVEKCCCDISISCISGLKITVLFSAQHLVIIVNLSPQNRKA